MDDLISRQAAVDAVFSLCGGCDSGYCGSCRVNYPGEKDVIKVIRNLPSAQTDWEVVYGEWIMINEQLAKCSVCGGYESTNGKDKTGKGVIFKMQKKFCPHCGAKMNERREDADL